MTDLSIIIPANNEAGYIEPCLEALIAQDWPGDSGGRGQIVVAANGCSDDTVALARGYAAQADAAGWDLAVLDIAQGSKPGALNAADAVATGGIRIYMDADIVADPDLIGALARVLDRQEAAYAGASIRVTQPASWISARYRDTWLKVPFMTQGVQGAGVFAVNAAGRARWGDFPDIISDDGFVRLQFLPHERHKVTPGYDWPLPEGWARLVKVRKRQDAGINQIAALYPDLPARDGTPPLGKAGTLRLALTQPISFAVYTAIKLAVRFGPKSDAFHRGR